MANNEKKSAMNIDMGGLARRLNAQFQGLDIRNPSAWPVIPRYILLVLITVVVVVLLWIFWLKDMSDQLSTDHDQETRLRGDYVNKLQQAVILDKLKEQKAQVAQYVESLEKQLPPKNEMDALLSDINQAGLSRGLQFDMFKPGTVVIKEHYAELPIAIKITGHYHDIGQFTADVAGLSRIVTLEDLNLVSADKNHPGQLTLSAMARTYRYLDPEEIEAQRKVKGGKK